MNQQNKETKSSGNGIYLQMFQTKKARGAQNLILIFLTCLNSQQTMNQMI